MNRTVFLSQRSAMKKYSQFSFVQNQQIIKQNQNFVTFNSALDDSLDNMLVYCSYESNHQSLVENADVLIKFVKEKNVRSNNSALQNLIKIAFHITRYKLYPELLRQCINSCDEFYNLAGLYAAKLCELYPSFLKQDFESKLESFVDTYQVMILTDLFVSLPEQFTSVLAIKCFGSIFQLLLNLKFKIDEQQRAIKNLFAILQGVLFEWKEDFFTEAVQCLTIICQEENNAVHLLTFQQRHRLYPEIFTNFYVSLLSEFTQNQFNDKIFYLVLQIFDTLKSPKQAVHLDPMFTFQIVNFYSQFLSQKELRKIVLNLFKCVSCNFPLFISGQVLLDILASCKSVNQEVLNSATFILAQISSEENPALQDTLNENHLHLLIQILRKQQHSEIVDNVLAFVVNMYWWHDANNFFRENDEFIQIIECLQESDDMAIVSTVKVFVDQWNDNAMF
ncbi:Armadillo-like_helical [Hexamita inflata]|uniref:Armadillo-like helical n=1 Tax=Hexamita inflata TaxID=28002 RepID=A0AA86UWT7_9EUKA|nr:Armadillo-like helical [Hexamita inflata]